MSEELFDRRARLDRQPTEQDHSEFRYQFTASAACGKRFARCRTRHRAKIVAWCEQYGIWFAVAYDPADQGRVIFYFEDLADATSFRVRWIDTDD